MSSDSTNPHGEKGLLEKTVDDISSTLQSFIDAQLLASSLLFVCIFIAVFMSNVEPINRYYQRVIYTPFGFHFNGQMIATTLHSFVNDFLLTIFFFVLGLEIKREFVIGELSELSKSMFVVLCALGGALLPVLTYLLINYNNPDTLHGWAIPMATDTALAIGVLYLFKNKVPSKMFTFVASLAVIDDILSIVVIALFYSDNFYLVAFLAAVVVFLLLIIINLCGFRHPLIYAVLAFVLWICVEKAGIHGTIAGVLAAMCIPARPKKTPQKAIKKIRGLLSRFEDEYDKDKHLLEDESPHQILEGVTDTSLEATTPLKRWENRLEMPVLVLILPLFALTNGGFNIDFTHLSSSLTSTLFWGIFLGLVVAKPTGVILTSKLIQALNIAKPPGSVRPTDIIVIAFLAGIGYTMSIFISELSFSSKALGDMAKLSIFISSICSAIVAFTFLKRRQPVTQDTNTQKTTRKN